MINKLLHVNWEEINWTELPDWTKNKMPKHNGEKRRLIGRHYEYDIINHTTSGWGQGNHIMSLSTFETYRRRKT